MPDLVGWVDARKPNIINAPTGWKLLAMELDLINIDSPVGTQGLRPKMPQLLASPTFSPNEATIKLWQGRKKSPNFFIRLINRS